MSNKKKNDVPDNQVPYDSVRPFAQGGTAEDYCQYLKESGQPCHLSRNGDVWFQNSGGELLRFPLPDNLTPPDAQEINNVLKHKRVYIASYICEPTGDRPPNAYLYVCRDSEYDISKQKKNARRDIRKGMRNFQIRLCTWDEIIEKGYAAEVDTQKRHGFVSPSKNEHAKSIQRLQYKDIFEIWGAWSGHNVASWILLCKINDSAEIMKFRSCTDYLVQEPNISLLYCLTKHMLVEEKRLWTCTGLSSIYEGTRIGLHRFKLRSGYEAIPVRREFVAVSALKPLMKCRAFSWCVEKATHIFPKYPLLRKVNGLLRLTSGREKDPLAWAQQDDKREVAK